MPRFTRAEDLRKHLEAAADRLQQEVIVTTQAQLGSTDFSPYDTGRFRSSWFAAEGSPSRAVAPKEADDENDDAKGLRIRGDQTYYLSNSLPYAQAVALGVSLPPSWGGKNRLDSKSPAWFTRFRNSNIPKIQRNAARQVKQEFDL